MIEIFTDEGDVVIDPVAGSGSTLVAAIRLNRRAYGFEIEKEFFTKAQKWIAEEKTQSDDMKKHGFAKTKVEKIQPSLF